MGLAHSPRIVTENLDMFLDASNPKSYSGLGTTWRDLTKNGYNGTLTRTTFSTAFGGIHEFDGLGESTGSPEGAHVVLNTTPMTTEPTAKPNGVTYDVWLRFQGEQPSRHALFWGAGTVNHIEWSGTLSGGSYRTEAVLQNGYSFGASSDGGHVVGEWYNLQIVFANDEIAGSPVSPGDRPVRWYRDGQLFHTGDMTSGTNPTGEYFNPSAFGKATGSSSFLYGQSFLGDLGILKVYNRTLTDAEVKQNYYAFRGRYN